MSSDKMYINNSTLRLIVIQWVLNNIFKLKSLYSFLFQVKSKVQFRSFSSFVLKRPKVLSNNIKKLLRLYLSKSMISHLNKVVQMQKVFDTQSFQILKDYAYISAECPRAKLHALLQGMSNTYKILCTRVFIKYRVRA